MSKENSKENSGGKSINYPRRIQTDDPSTGLVHCGYENFLSHHHIRAIASADSGPQLRRLRQAKADGRLINLTHGRKTRTVVYLTGGVIALVSLTPRVLADRMRGL